MNLLALWWLGHVLRMSNSYLHQRTMLGSAEIGLKKARDCQTKTWHQSKMSLIIGFSHVSRRRLPVWSPFDYFDKWLKTRWNDSDPFIMVQLRSLLTLLSILNFSIPSHIPFPTTIRRFNPSFYHWYSITSISFIIFILSC